MRNVLTIARRELAAYFASPMFWVLATAFMLFAGLTFTIVVSSPGAQADMAPLLGLHGTIFLFVTPLLAMRLLAEEKRSGTLELLMTSPVSDWQVVWGKWLGAFGVVAVMIAFTLFHVGMMLRLATNGMAMGPLAANYLGLFLLGGLLLALGVLTSSLSENQVVAGFLGIMLIMLLWFIGLVEQVLGPDSAVGKAFAYAGLSDHYFNFGQGVIDSRDLLYMVSLTVGALFLATRILESRRWR